MKCAFCGKELTGRNQLKFCSLQCQHNDRTIKSQEKRKRVCIVCGNEFVMPQMSAKAMRGEIKSGLYCSRKCRWEYERNALYCNVYFKVCAICGRVFTSRMESNDKYCSKECRKELIIINCKKQWMSKSKKYDANGNVKERHCKECGKQFIPQYGNLRRTFCSKACCYKNTDRKSRAVRRARKYGNNCESFDPREVFMRDGWRCQMCRVKTPAKLRGSIKDNAPELDHIIPLALGGEHSMRNTQCLCRKCNQNKGATARGQLRLFG